jgi:VanZ family protein
MSSARRTEEAVSVAAMRPAWQALLPSGWHPAWVLASYAVVALVTWASLRPSNMQFGISQLDKYGHVLAYLVLATWFMGFSERARHWRVGLWLFVFSGGIEVAQALMRIGRTGEAADLVANGVGLVFGALLSQLTVGWPRRVEDWLRERRA